MTKLWTMVLLASALLASTGCSGDEDSAEEQAAAEPQAAEEAAPAEEAPPPEPAGPCPEENQLTITNLDGSEHLAGVDASFAPAAAFADPSFGYSATLVFASFEPEADPQFGLSAPMGNFDGAPADGLLFTLRIDGDQGEDLEPGEYTSDGTDLGRVSFTSMYVGENRVLPTGGHTVQLTEITDEHICGEIVPTEGSSMQSNPQVAGRFRLDKV